MNERTYTPPELAKLWRVSPDKILAFIRRGELRAFNVASRRRGRPRFRILADEVERFTEARAVKPPGPRKPARSREYRRLI